MAALRGALRTSPASRVSLCLPAARRGLPLLHAATRAVSTTACRCSASAGTPDSADKRAREEAAAREAAARAAQAAAVVKRAEDERAAGGAKMAADAAAAQQVQAAAQGTPPAQESFIQYVARNGIDSMLGPFHSSGKFDSCLGDAGMECVSIGDGEVECVLVVPESLSNTCEYGPWVPFCGFWSSALTGSLWVRQMAPSTAGRSHCAWTCWDRWRCSQRTTRRRASAWI